MNILTINIGNSRVAVGLYQAGHLQWVEWSAHNQALVQGGLWLGKKVERLPIDYIGISSVVPAAEKKFRRALANHFPAVPVCWMSSALSFPFALDVDYPEQVGTDRLMSVAGAVDLLGAPCLVCDFGTLTTFNVVTKRHGFRGGAIVPGFGGWFATVAREGARLPDLSPAAAPVNAKIGRNTELAIQLGAQWGYQGMIETIISKLKKASGIRGDMPCVATGGWAPVVMARTGLSMPVIPDLALYGIATTVARNAGI